MPKVPYIVTKESYVLKSTFFYSRLKSMGYFDLFENIKKFIDAESARLNWNDYGEWGIDDDAWSIAIKNGLNTAMVFLHPKVLALNPEFLKYYRSIAMIPQKGLKTLSGVSNVDKIENGEIEGGKISSDKLSRIVKEINEIVSLILTLAAAVDEENLKGMMYATAGTNIEGSWRNAIGSEGERVVRAIILKEIVANNEITSVKDKQDKIHTVDELDLPSLPETVDQIKHINLINGYTMVFASEPDISLLDDKGDTVGVIEIKAGLDPAGALERLGAMLKSFENTLAEFPGAKTVLVASCITDEVEARLSASDQVRQKYILTDITTSDSNRRKFANRIRKILNLI